jgi:competence protein ComEC
MAFPCWWKYPQVMSNLLCILPCFWFIHARVMIFIIIAVLSTTWAVFRLNNYHTTRILVPSSPMIIKGYIISILQDNHLYKKILFHVEQMPAHFKCRNLLLSSFREHVLFHVGDAWQFEVKLKPPHTLQNPIGANGMLNFYLKKIDGTGYILNKSQNNRKLKENAYGFVLFRFRQKVLKAIGEIPQKNTDDMTAILKTLSIGYRRLSQKMWKIFQQTGTSHLMAISGLHVSLIASIVYYSVRKLWASFYFLTYYVPAFRAGAFCAILAALSYGALSGFALPTQRAVIMIFTLMLEKLMNRYSPIYWRLLLALILVLIIQPLSVLTHSFWLSFTAVFCIIYFFYGHNEKRSADTVLKKLIQWGKVQWVVFLGLLPISLLFFGQISLWFFIANCMAIPWICFIILPLILIAMLVLVFSFELSVSIFKWAAVLLEPLLFFLKWLAHFKWATWHHPIMRIWVVLIAYFGVFCLLSRQWHRFRWFGFLGFIPLFFFASPVLKEHDFHLVLFDVGQGLASLVKTKNHILIYDTGPYFLTGFNTATHILLPYLLYAHIHFIDKLMVSHDDIDHSGGVNVLFKHLAIKDFLTSHPKKFKLYSARKCYKGQHWQWDGVDFNVLWPLKTSTYVGNNSSCVLKVSNGKKSILLTGDIQLKTEDQLVKQQSKQLKSTLLIVPHHGSYTSSSSLFLSAVNPKYALFSTGYLNRFHFPSRRILERYQKTSAYMLNTAVNGAIQVDIHGNGQVNLHLMRYKEIF